MITKEVLESIIDDFAKKEQQAEKNFQGTNVIEFKSRFRAQQQCYHEMFTTLQQAIIAESKYQKMMREKNRT